MEDTEMFYPQCNYIKDDVEDKYIVIGRLCNAIYTDEYGTESHKGEGCRAGTYTWETNGNVIMVYDVEALIGAIFEIFAKGFGSFSACCCGCLLYTSPSPRD